MISLHSGIIGAILKKILDIDPNTFVVGGAVRDRFLGRSPNNDLDLAFRLDGADVAEKIVSAFGEGVTHVPLEKETGTSRIVVWKDVFASLDVCKFKGSDIYEDLSRRDFTINAMAVPLRDFIDSKVLVTIDPMGGRADLSKSLIRICTRSCFLDDPLRILRAFRFCTLLGFHIDEDTRQLLRQSVPLLGAVAGERLRDELFFILCEKNASQTLDMIHYDGVLDALFPELIPSRGCEQNDYHHLDVLDHSLETLRCLEMVVTHLPEPLAPFQDYVTRYLNGEIVTGRPRKALLKIAALFHDVGKPFARTVDTSGRMRFSGHEVVSQRMVKDISSRLRLSRKEQEAISHWVGGHMRSSVLSMSPPSTRALRRLCREFGDDVIGLLLLAIADKGATKGPRSNALEAEAMNAAAYQVVELCLQKTVTPPKPFLSGRDLMSLFGMREGRELGNILRIVRELQDEGVVTTRAEALSEVARLLGQ